LAQEITDILGGLDKLQGEFELLMTEAEAPGACHKKHLRIACVKESLLKPTMVIQSIRF